MTKMNRPIRPTRQQIITSKEIYKCKGKQKTKVYVMSTIEQKKWEQPTLMILAKNHPEECVLTKCKNVAAGASNAANTQNNTCAVGAATCKMCAGGVLS